MANEIFVSILEKKTTQKTTTTPTQTTFSSKLIDHIRYNVPVQMNRSTGWDIAALMCVEKDSAV